MADTHGFLRNVPLFSGLADSDLDRLCELVDALDVAPGELLFREGEMGDRAYVIQRGRLEIVKQSAGREVLLAVRGPGEVVGEMSLLEEAPRMAAGRARETCRVLAVSRAVLEDLVGRSPTAALALFQGIVGRLRATTSSLRQSERMAQLGTMAAGIAHELNNPAAAVRRGADQLGLALKDHDRARRVAVEAGLASSEIEGFEAAAAELVPRVMTALERSDAEQELEDALAERGIEDAFELAPRLVEVGLDGARVAVLTGTGQGLSAALGVLAARGHIGGLLREIGEGARRLSEIVSALKSYSYLDQAPLQEVDLHKGLDDTLVLLRHKLKGSIRVERQYDPALPRVQGRGGELNQVWTNLIDNAADALGEKGGTITLRTAADATHVKVEVEDDGPGIPEELRERIFDAFFTTKPPGKGTGLGLDISWRIVVDRHGGDIKVFSRPGRTTFSVLLPRGDAPAAVGGAESDDALLGSILETSRTIAAVGVSTRADRPAHSVPRYLLGAGYDVIPIHPSASEVFGVPAFSSLDRVDRPVDVVLVFRPAEEVPAIAEQAIKIGAKTLWLQEGIVHDEAARRAREAGLAVVMDTCMRTTHKRLMRGRRTAPEH